MAEVTRLRCHGSVGQRVLDLVQAVILRASVRCVQAEQVFAVRAAASRSTRARLRARRSLMASRCSRYRAQALGVCEPGQEAALRPAAANGLGAQGRPAEQRQADDAVAGGAAIAKRRYRGRDADPLR